MILAFDTYYSENKAKTVCICFENWTDTDIVKVHTEILEDVEEYTSGEFYKRELPCILSLLSKIDIPIIEAIVVDGFVFLDDDKKLGLGGYLYQKLEGNIPIIGLAKNNFASLQNHKRALLRGESRKPIYITAIGIDVDIAESYIKSMAGEYRIPKLLKILDTLSREENKN